MEKKKQFKKSAPVKEKITRADVLVHVLRALLIAFAAVILLTVLIRRWPDIEYKRALKLTSTGHLNEAVLLLDKLSGNSYDAEKLENGYIAAAEKALESGDFDTADKVAAQITDPEDRQSLLTLSAYERAEKLFSEGSYAEACRSYYAVYGYRDAEEKYLTGRCALAIRSYKVGDMDEVNLLLANMPDVEKHISDAALLTEGNEAGARTLLLNSFFSPENLQNVIGAHQLQAFKAELDAMPEGKIACGKGFTLAVASDGTVLAAGDNEFGQTDIAGTKNAVMVAAGTKHSAALLRDGTVIASGDNGEGQCDVGEWTDIVKLACSGYDTLGIKQDGSVVIAGMHKELAGSWHDAALVCGGAYSVGCITENGTMLTNSKAAMLENGGILRLTLCGPVSAAILPDESVVCSAVDISSWKDIVSIKAGTMGVFGIDKNGRVQAYFFRATDAMGLSIPEKAIEIELSGTHIAILGESGRVYCFGDNASGQCDTENWIASVN